MITPWLVATASALPACLATDFCGAADDPCVVSASYEVTDGCTPDFAGRAVEVTGAGRIDVQTGSVTLSAGALTVLSGGDLRGRDGGVLRIELDGAFSFDGNADFTTNAAPGELTVDADGITVTAPIDANARVAAGDGGVIHLVSRGDLDVVADLDASGGGDGAGGTVGLSGDAITVSGTLDVRGGSFGAGLVGVSSGSTLDLAGTVWANNTADGDGGAVHLTAAGDVVVDSPLHASGGGGGYFGGYGGVVTVRSDGGAVDLLDAIEANGASPDGEGGVVRLEARGALSVLATIDAKGVGIGGTGGYLTLSGRDSVLVDATANVSGGAYGGGVATIWSHGPVDVLANVFANGGGTYYYGNGDGGSVYVHSDLGPLATTGRLAAQGGSPDGYGGFVSVSSHGAVSVGGALEAFSAGTGWGAGGIVRVHGTASVTFDATIDASGGAGDGGEVTIRTAGDLEAQALVDVNASNGGNGGTASLVALSAATLSAQVSANGLGGGGGGAIEVYACEVALESTARLDAAEAGGTTEITVLLGGNIDGDLDAGSSNTVSWGPWGAAPVFGAASSRTPAEVAAMDPTLPSCQCPFGNDADGDLVCDPADVCPGGDDTVDTDGDGVPDACDGP